MVQLQLRLNCVDEPCLPHLPYLPQTDGVKLQFATEALLVSDFKVGCESDTERPFNAAMALQCEWVLSCL